MRKKPVDQARRGRRQVHAVRLGDDSIRCASPTVVPTAVYVHVRVVADPADNDLAGVESLTDWKLNPWVR